MTPRKPSAPAASESAERPCAYCDTLERKYEDTIAHIREVLEVRFENIGAKIRELHKWQENRDEAIEMGAIGRLAMRSGGLPHEGAEPQR